MTAATVRLASADVEAPASELTAKGEVAVNGHAEADMPPARSGPPRPRSLSPARAALSDHLSSLVRLSAEAERVSKPVDRLREQLSAAMVELQNAELILANLDKAHSAEIARAARDNCCSAEPVESADAEAAVSRSRRHVNSVRQALDECAQDQIKANANLEAARARFDQIALAILVEEHETRLEHWAQARDAFYLAEVELVGLHECIGAYGRTLQEKAPGAGIPWLQQLERLRPPWYHLEAGHVEERGPREIAASASRWSAVTHRLKSDPNATF
jgi:hypothetical protein